MASWRLTFDLRIGNADPRRVVVTKAEGERCVIGRSRQADVFCESNAISRVHCSVTVTNGEAFIEDERSSGGTFVNRQRLRGRTPLRAGDVFFAGQPMLTLVSVEPA